MQKNYPKTNVLLVDGFQIITLLHRGIETSLDFKNVPYDICYLVKIAKQRLPASIPQTFFFYLHLQNISTTAFSHYLKKQKRTERLPRNN